MKQSQTGIRKLLSRMSTPDTIGVLVVCFYVVNWLIYPEALEYMNITIGQPIFGVMETSPVNLRSLNSVCINNPEGRLLMGVVEVGIGTLRACILFAILYSSSLYVYRYSRVRWAKRTFTPLVVALLTHLLYLVALAWILVTFPDHFNIKVVVAALLYYSSLAVAASVGIAIAYHVGIIVYKHRSKIIDGVYTSLHLFRKR